MAEPKTVPTGASVPAFLARVTDPQLRADCDTVVRLMEGVTKAPATMWGSSIVGFGSYRYVYASGRQGDWPLAGFAPRGKNLVLYVMPGFEGYDALMKALGPHSRGVSCVYVKRLADLHLPTLRKLVRACVLHTRKTHAASTLAAAASRPAPKARKSAKARTITDTPKAAKTR